VSVFDSFAGLAPATQLTGRSRPNLYDSGR